MRMRMIKILSLIVMPLRGLGDSDSRIQLVQSHSKDEVAVINNAKESLCGKSWHRREAMKHGAPDEGQETPLLPFLFTGNVNNTTTITFLFSLPIK